jgi:hypothetical protein
VIPQLLFRFSTLVRTSMGAFRCGSAESDDFWLRWAFLNTPAKLLSLSHADVLLPTLSTL